MKNYSKYLISTDLEKQWGLYVTTTGHTKIDINQQYPQNASHPKSHAFNWNKGRILDGFYLVFISRGTGVFESAKSELTAIKEGHCFLLFPDVWHRYKPNEKSGWEEYWVGFNGDYAINLMSAFFDPARPLSPLGLNDVFLSLFLQLLETIKITNPGYHQIVSGLVLQMLGLFK